MKISRELYNDTKEELKKIELEIAEWQIKLKEAAEYGDLSENSEYDNAMNKLTNLRSLLEIKRNVLKDAEIEENTSEDNTQGLRLNSTFKLRSCEGEDKFTLVTSEMASPFKNSISINSILGKLLIGRKVGDEIKVSAFNSTATFQIIEIY